MKNGYETKGSKSSSVLTSEESAIEHVRIKNLCENAGTKQALADAMEIILNVSEKQISEAELSGNEWKISVVKEILTANLVSIYKYQTTGERE